MRVEHRIEPVGMTGSSGRLRFSVTTAAVDAELRLMVLDTRGQVQHRMTVQPSGPRTALQLTGFRRGQAYLVCAFRDDDLVWSAPVLAG